MALIQTSISENERLVPQPEFRRRLGLKSAMTLWKWVHRRPELELPKPIKIGNRCYYRLSEILAWEQKMAARAVQLAAEPMLSKNGKRVGRPPKQRAAS